MVYSLLGLSDPTPGFSVDGVVDIISVEDRGSLGRWLPGFEEVEILGSCLPLGRLSIYGMLIHEVGEKYIQATLTQDAWWAIYQATDSELTPAILELCAGFGGMGIGAGFLGGKPVVSVDFTELACSHLRANHHGQVLHLDLI